MTEVSTKDCGFTLAASDPVLVMGSCFAANIGERLSAEGYDVCLNPFGTIFNPASIALSLERLQSGEPFSEEDCIQMGAGIDKWCSLHHYTKFARESRQEFLSHANERLSLAHGFFLNCKKVIITFGTSYVFKHKERNLIVSNCLRRPAAEFERYRLDISAIVDMWKSLMAPGGPLDGKKVLFTVSPIRHLADTAHGNQLSKATLLLAVDELMGLFPAASYFPAYEIVLDELRDYSYYADDLVHPSAEAVNIIWERFRTSVLR